MWSVTMPHSDRAPVCSRCGNRHLEALPCWGGRYVGVIRDLVLGVYGDTCHICGDPGAWSVDHRTPRSFGGTDVLDNLRPTHLLCNQRRGTTPLATRPAPVVASSRW